MTLHQVHNFTQGRWWSAPGGTTVVDAVTGEPFARVSAEGLDAEGVLRHARQAALELRPAGFAGRAALVKQLALALKERRGELIELSAHTGATEADASLDVDGAIGTALVFASKAARGLPATNLLAEGEIEPLGRGGTFAGRHVLTPLTGVAVQINAYNFPVWGMVEKLAPALIAGVPSVVKPATQTAYVAERAVRIMVESGLLPDGSLQLVCGSAAGLLDLLGGQDLISFTGSAGTAASLRRLQAVTQRSVRFNAETDSLNAAVLGPDAGPGSAEYELYLAAVITELICKAGQRCTAIRRVLVPEHLLDQVCDELVVRLESVVVGAPGMDAVGMGALAGPDQRAGVVEAVHRLRASAAVLTGGGPPGTAVGADPVKGAFLAPTLLRSADPDRSEPHEIEAFGPVATVLGYRDLDHAVALLARGGGSLVASVVSHDAEAVRALVIAAAPQHGRILVLDRDCAGESTGHGTPMPQLVHGGPGRAGGGEEEGGLRAVVHYLQRTALQGSPQLLGRLAGD